MTSRPESDTPTFDSLSTRVERHVARHLERGDNVFYARPLLASIAIGLMTGQRHNEARQVTAQVAITTLEAHDAEGEVFAVRQDLGNGLEDSRDRVRVTRRSGVVTSAKYGTERTPGRAPVIRAETAKRS